MDANIKGFTVRMYATHTVKMAPNNLTNGREGTTKASSRFIQKLQ